MEFYIVVCLEFVLSHRGWFRISVMGFLILMLNILSRADCDIHAVFTVCLCPASTSFLLLITEPELNVRRQPNLHTILLANVKEGSGNIQNFSQLRNN